MLGDSRLSMWIVCQIPRPSLNASKNHPLVRVGFENAAMVPLLAVLPQAASRSASGNPDASSMR